MTDRLPLDRVRDRIAGVCAPEEALAVDRLLAEDPELARWAEQYAEVHRLTEDAVPVGEPGLAWEQVEWILDGAAARPRRRWWIGAGLAAAAALVVGLALWMGRSNDDWNPPTGPVVLAAVPLDPPAAPPPEPDALVPVLADWAPVGEDGIRWVEELSLARSIAARLDRPLLVFVTMESCPLCVAMESGVFREPPVLDRIRGYVPVRIDARRLTPQALAAVFETGWPYFEVQASDGTVRRAFAGMQTGPGLLEALGAPDAEPVDWASLGAGARTLASAESHAASGAWGQALASFQRVEGPRWAEARAAGLARVREAARASLAEAAAAPDVAAATRRLESAAEAFAETPYEADFLHVLERLRATGRFPELETPR